MADPVSILTGVTALLTSIFKIYTSVSTLHDRYQRTNTVLSALHTEISTTKLALSQLSKSLRDVPDVESVIDNANDDLRESFDVALIGIAATLDVLGKEMGKIPEGEGVWKKARWVVWDEGVVKVWMGDLRDQRISIGFLIASVQNNKIDAIPRKVVEQFRQHLIESKLELRRVSTKARSHRIERIEKLRAPSKVEDTDLESIFSLDSEYSSFEATLLQSKPYRRVQSQEEEVQDHETMVPSSAAPVVVQPETPKPSQRMSMAELTATLRSSTLTSDTTTSAPVQKIPRTIQSSPLHEAIARKDDYFAVRYLRDGGDVNVLLETAIITSKQQYQPPITPLIHAAIMGMKATIFALIQHGVDVNVVLRDKKTALICAIIEGHSHIAYTLVTQSKASATHADDTGMTALHYAASMGERNVILGLVNKGTDFDVLDENGFSALHYAATNGHLSVVDAVLKVAGVNVNARSKPRRMTPLHCAAHGRDTAVVKFLLKYGAKVNMTDIEGNTCLHLAAKEGHAEVIDILLDKGDPEDAVSSISPLTQMGITPDKFAIMIKDLSPEHTLQLLTAMNNMNGNSSQAAANAAYNLLEVRNKDGATALVMAVYASLECVKLLLTHGADIETRDGMDQTVLHAAMFTKNPEDRFAMVAELLEGGAGRLIDVVTKAGETALYCAMWYATGVELRQLLAAGADTTMLIPAGDGAQHTVLWFAIANAKSEMIDVLREYDAVSV